MSERLPDENPEYSPLSQGELLNYQRAANRLMTSCLALTSPELSTKPLEPWDDPRKISFTPNDTDPVIDEFEIMVFPPGKSYDDDSRNGEIVASIELKQSVFDPEDSDYEESPDDEPLGEQVELFITFELIESDGKLIVMKSHLLEIDDKQQDDYVLEYDDEPIVATAEELDALFDIVNNSEKV